MAPFMGGEHYLLFGTELHLRALKNRKGKWKPYKPPLGSRQINNEEAEAMAMLHGVKAIRKNKLFIESIKGAIIEKKLKRDNCFGIWGMHGTLDINNRKRKRTVDLKTTSAETEEEFQKKCIQLSYPRQGVVYEELSGNTETFFIGIGKKNIEPDPQAPPIYPIFEFELNNYAKEKDYAKEEAEFLLTFFKENGLPISRYINRKKFE